MKNTTLTTLTTLSSLVLVTTLNAQVAKWDHTAFDTSGHSQYSCITPSNYSYQGVSRSNVNGSDNSAGGANCFGQWNENYESNYAERVQYKFSAASLLSAGGLKSVAFDIKRYSGGPEAFAVRLFKNTSVVWEHKDKGTNLTWTNEEFKINDTFVAGDMYTLQVQAYKTGSASNPRIALDNVTFHGEAKCVPEPSSTALLGLGGLALILRRRK